MEEQKQQKTKKRVGFATMTPEARAEISRKGGRAAQATGKGHRWAAGSDEVKAAGRKGGHAAHAKQQRQQGTTQTEWLESLKGDAHHILGEPGEFVLDRAES
jgi:general stress protein YciG